MTNGRQASEFPIAVPSLDEVAVDPRRLAGLSSDAIKALLMRNAVVQSALAAALQSAPNQTPQPFPEEDRMLTPDEAAQILRRSRLWVYRNANRLPFVKRISRKSLLCSEAGVKRWLATRKA